MMIARAVPFLLLSSAAYAEDTNKLTGAGIKSLLPTVVSRDDNSRQIFDSDGKTLYENQRGPSRGSWRVDGDQYCSVWPPSGDWTCYDVALHTDKDGKRWLTWTSRGGDSLTWLKDRPKPKN